MTVLFICMKENGIDALHLNHFSSSNALKNKLEQQQGNQELRVHYIYIRVHERKRDRRTTPKPFFLPRMQKKKKNSRTTRK